MANFVALLVCVGKAVLFITKASSSETVTKQMFKNFYPLI